jgi:hypothetical protein
MAEARRYLAGLGLPDRDLGELPTSGKRFADGAQYRVEIPSVEGPAPFRAVVEAATERDLRVHRISQGSGMLLLTDDEIREMVALGRDRDVEVCLFVGPRAAWDVGVQATAPAGPTSWPTGSRMSCGAAGWGSAASWSPTPASCGCWAG